MEEHTLFSSSELQSYLISKFTSWRPTAPEVVTRRKGDITLDWHQGQFAFLKDHLIYRLEKNEKIPKWIVVYSGGKTSKRIDDLAPRHPHRFRVKVILKATAVPRLANLALQHHGDEDAVYEAMEQPSDELDNNHQQNNNPDDIKITDETAKTHDAENAENKQVKIDNIRQLVEALILAEKKKKINGEGDGIRGEAKSRWLESRWSGETWTNTEADGTSPACFGMAVQRGYHKQIQSMVEERPALLDLVNTNTGHTPLATAVRTGDAVTVQLLLSLGASVQQPSLAEQTPLHLAVLAGDLTLVQLLMEKGADPMARDCNGLRVEHYAVDSGSLDMVRYIFDHGGDVAVTDNTGWTPLFRALCEGSHSSIVSELMRRGSDTRRVDAAGLPLLSAAKLLRNRHGAPRDSILRLVDSQYPREKALAHFTRVSRKIHHLHTLLRLN